MLNSWHLTGERIRLCRNEKGLTQEALSEAIENITGVPIKRQTIAKWENGTPVKKIEQLTALCEIFDCDTAYLLGECDSKRIISQAIAPALGISEKALDNLITAHNQEDPYIEILSKLLENETILQYITKCTTEDYGEISTFIDIPSIFSKNNKNSVFINPSVLGKSELMILYGMLCKFIDDARAANDLPRINK